MVHRVISQRCIFFSSITFPNSLFGNDKEGEGVKDQREIKRCSEQEFWWTGVNSRDQVEGRRSTDVL